MRSRLAASNAAELRSGWAAWESLEGFSFGVQTGPVGDLQGLRVGVGEQDGVQAGDRVADIEGGGGEFRGAQDGAPVGDERLGVARQRAGVGETLAGAVIATDLGEFGDGWLDQGPGGAGGGCRARGYRVWVGRGRAARGQ